MKFLGTTITTTTNTSSSSTPASRARDARINSLVRLAIVGGGGWLGGLACFFVFWRDACVAKVQEARTAGLANQQQQQEQQISLWKEQISQAQRELTQEREEHEYQRRLWEHRVAEAEQSNAADNSNSKNDAAAAAQELAQLQAALTQQSRARLMLDYGKFAATTSDGYLVELQLDLASEAVMLKIAFPRHDPPHDMAHTIHTFLTLVSLGFYEDTTLELPSQHSYSNNNFLVGGHPKQAVHRRAEAKLTRQYFEHFGRLQPLLLPEVSLAHPCRAGTLGLPMSSMDGSSSTNIPEPSFVIMRNDGFQDGSLSCPGRVVEGFEELMALVEKSNQQNAARIVSARVVVAPPEEHEETTNDDPEHVPREEL